MEASIKQANLFVATLHQRGEYAEGLELAREVGEIARRDLGERHPEYAQALSNLGNFYLSFGNLALAEQEHAKALAVRRAVLGPDDPSLAQSLNNLAEVYRQTGRFAAADPLYEEALAIRRRALGDNHPGVANVLNNLGLLCVATGEYARATTLLGEALGIFRTNQGPASMDVARSLNNLGLVYRLTGTYARAEASYLQAIAIMRADPGANPLELAQDLDNCGEVYRQTGAFEKAEALFLEARSLIQESIGERNLEFATNLNNLGELYCEVGLYEEAQTSFEQALMLLRELQVLPNYITVLNNLALLLQMTGNYEDSVRWLQVALETRRNILGDSHPDVAQSLNNLGAAYQEMGEYVTAEQLYQEALALRRALWTSTHPDVAETLNNLGAVYLMMGDPTRAETALREALEILRAAARQYHPAYLQTLTNLVHLCVVDGRPADALDFMREVHAVEQGVLGQVFSFSSERQRMAHLATVDGTFALLLSLVSQHLPEHSDAIRLALEVTLRRKGLGAEALAAQRDAILSGHYPDLAPKIEAMRMLRAQIASRALADPDPDAPEARTKQLTTWGAELEQLEAELARAIPEMHIEQTLHSADGPAVAGAVPRDAALIEYVQFRSFDFAAVPARGETSWKPARYVCFVVPGQRAEDVRMIDLGEAAVIDELVGACRDEMMTVHGRHAPRVTAPSPNAVEPAGAALRSIILDPMLAAGGDCRQLIIAPDGALCRLPLEALPTASGGRVIDDYKISYVVSGRDVLRFGAARTRQPAAPIVAADPDFDLVDEPAATSIATAAPARRSLAMPAMHFDRLIGTRDEGEQVADSLGVTPLFEGQVLEALLKSSRSPRILHLATHGFFLPDQDTGESGGRTLSGAFGAPNKVVAARLENPLLRSGLALAGANRRLDGTLPPEAEDGILTAEDVTGMDLSDTDLVVLSACETGLGQVRVGEGVFGLRRAFVLAGAKTLVMSLWKVPDRQTQELMSNFYDGILSGVPRAEALRQAQLTIKETYPDPVFWGAFICQGDAGALPV